MHLRSRCLPRSSDNISLDNRAHPMANTSQASDLEGFHRALVIVDALIRQTEPPFIERVLRARVFSKFKLSTQFEIYKGKTDPMDHLNSYKSLMSLENCSNEVMCKALHRQLHELQNQTEECLSPLHRSPKGNRGLERLQEDMAIGEEEIYNLSSLVVDAHPPITFSNDDLRSLYLPHDDALVILAVIANFNVQRMLVDNGSSADILLISAFDQMTIGLDKLHPFHTPLVGFKENMTHSLRWIKLPVTLGTDPHQITVCQDFIVVDCPSPYNAILGHPTLRGLMLQIPSGEQMEHVIQIGFKATNNEAEYETLLASLKVAAELGVDSLDVFNDSQLVLRDFKIRQILREENKKIDALANLVLAFDFILDRTIPLEYLSCPSIEVAKSAYQANTGPTWLDNIIVYLKTRVLPSNKLQARWIQYRSAKFCILNGILYKQSFSGPLLRCLRPNEVDYVMREIHEGICGNHSGARSLMKKAILQESVILVVIGIPSFRTSNFNKENNEPELRPNLDLLDERRESTEIRQEPNAEKIGPTWEGSYKVIKISRLRTYWLEDTSRKALSHPWNTEHLKKYYK
ncbi:hypothetical protein Acr_00g0051440 [Actinidia rufa]|uniref:RNase H type-1 domain-containing protein n=1 Tax=Actinidia rufa TaxID=165716 RepID=A0A7J0DKT1_9ERIC|nr:hypothetical protein Acr_00g0051440 [Actinidia rufa]